MVEFDDADFRAGVGLLAAEAGDPAIEVAKFALEGQDFADGAAEVRLALPEFGALCFFLLLNSEVGMQGLNGKTEEVLETFFEFERFGEKEAGVEREDGELNPVLLREVHHDQAGALKTRADGGAGTEPCPGPGKHLFRGASMKLLVEQAHIRRGERQIGSGECVRDGGGGGQSVNDGGQSAGGLSK